MKKLSSFVLSVLSILAVFTLFASSSSANEKTFVDISKYNVSNISGNATKGARVSVLLNNKKKKWVVLTLQKVMVVIKSL